MHNRLALSERTGLRLERDSVNSLTKYQLQKSKLKSCSEPGGCVS